MKNQSKAKECPIRELLSLHEYLIDCQVAIIEGNYNDAMRLLLEMYEGKLVIDVNNWNENSPFMSMYIRNKAK